MNIEFDRDRIVLSGRSVGKSTELANDWENAMATQARILFVQQFPQLAPLMYSLKLDRQPLSVGEWLVVMQHELDHAHASMRDNVAFDLAINMDMVGEG